MITGLAKITISEREGGSWSYTVSYGGTIVMRGSTRTTGDDGLRGIWREIGLCMEQYARDNAAELAAGGRR